MTTDAAAEHGDSLRRTGRTCWAVVGIAAAAVITAATLGAFAGLVIPLVVAAVMGTLLHPLVDRLERARLPRSIGSGLVLVGLAVIVVVSVWITVIGIIDQSDQISEQVTSGLEYLDREVGGQWDPTGGADAGSDRLGDALPGVFGGLSTWFGSVFSSLAAFVVGTGIAMFFLYYVLRDWRQLTSWLGGHLGVDLDLGTRFVADATGAIRSYFGAITLSSVVIAVVIGLAAIALDVPLAFSIALVTFVTSYVPYIGALFSGAFAVLIALGAAGVTEAVVMLIVILVAQTLVQTLLVTKMSSKSLQIHPIVNLGSTIVGGVVAGLLGATLSAPVVAIILLVRGDVTGRRHGEPGGPAGSEVSAR